MFNAFSWQGELIDDIEAWARDRGEKMVRVRFVPQLKPNALTGQMVASEPYIKSMPESFWDNYIISSDQDPGYEIERFDP